MKHHHSPNGSATKNKKINVIPGQLFFRQCKAKFLLETESHCIDDEGKVQSVTDTDNEFTDCQRLRKKLQSTGISPVSLHALPQHSRITSFYDDDSFSR